MIQILPEAELLIDLKDKEEFPHYFLHDYIDKKYILVEPLYGPNLQSLLILCGGNFDIITICRIGIEILNLLEIIHLKGYLYIYLKPDNICILLNEI